MFRCFRSAPPPAPDLSAGLYCVAAAPRLLHPLCCVPQYSIESYLKVQATTGGFWNWNRRTSSYWPTSVICGLNSNQGRHT